MRRRGFPAGVLSAYVEAASHRANATAGWTLDRALAWLVGLTLVALLASWIPHYLTWPWFRDLDAFGTMAQHWDAGAAPYRDIRAYNFPGQIYILWILGKTVGWGHTAAFYAVDVAFLLAVLVMLLTWSARSFDSALPGLAAGLWFLSRYLNLDYSQVAQRDWQATCLVVMALLVLQSVRRGGHTSSALLAAAAFAFRPHVLLFLPAFVSAVHENADAGRADAAQREPAGSFATWSVVFLSGVVCVFAPLIIAGVLPDFLRNLRIAGYGGPYSQNSPSLALATLVEELTSGWTACLLAVAFLMAFAAPPELRRRSHTWSLALCAALLYKPLHPVQHLYLQRPLELTGAVVAGLAVAWIVQSRALPSPVALVSYCAILFAAMPTIPQYCNVRESIRAVRESSRGSEPDRAPLGARVWFSRSDAAAAPYSWIDYRSVLDYVRNSTGSGTLVANVLRRFPFPPINAPTGRLSPFMVESGICWMWLVAEDLDATFAAQLERASDSVVVWIPDEPQVDPRMQLEQLTAAIRRCYRPAARFGRIEVWRRAAPAPLTPPATFP